MESFGEILIDTLLDAFKDSIYLLPFLFLTYVVMEVIEHKTALSTQKTIRSAGKFGPLLGSLLGIVPQCGFSAVASTLYAGRVITIGTLIAVFLSTSDEMLPIFIAKGVDIEQMICVLGAKFAIGVAIGFLIDFVARAMNISMGGFKIHELCERAKCECSDDCSSCKSKPESVYEHYEDESSCHHHHHHTHDRHHRSLVILKSSLIHTLQVLFFIFIVTWAINIAIESIGEDVFSDYLSSNETVSIFLSAAVGLIPNCAASVVIADLWVDGALATPAMMSGLLVSSGIGYLVLFRTNRRPAENAQIIFIMIAVAIIAGILIQLFLPNF